MKRLADHLSRRLLRRIEIRYRLIGSFVLLSLLPLVVSGYISYVESTLAIAERTRVLSTEVVKQVSKNILLEMAALESDSEALVLSDRVQAALAAHAGAEYGNGAARADLTRALIERYGSVDFIDEKYFLDRDNRIIDSQVFAALGAGVVRFVAVARSRSGKPSWGIYEQPGGATSMVLLRPIYSKANNRLLGHLFLGMRPAHFAAIFDDVNLGAGTDIVVLDAARGALLVKPGAPQGVMQADPALLARIRPALAAGQRSGFVSYHQQQGQPFLAAFARIPQTDWCVVSTIPQDKLTAEARSVLFKLVLVGLGCFGLSIGLAVIIARSIAGPLETLVRSMRETEAGNYANRMTPEGNDELTALAHKFNEMASKVDLQNLRLEQRVLERTSDLAAANSKLAALSMTDGLTSIANRRRFDEALLVELHRAARSRTPLALLMLDVDFFKNYNDLYGHQEGDACLRRVARLLQSHARRAGDLVARYGGEEFVMLAADTDAATALALAEAIRAALEALALPHERSPLGCVSTSIGVVALVPDEDMSADMLVRMADKAMYRAKDLGRNRVMLSGRKVEA
jgi:diguanylate cyclase (GGDEF)-like protein